MVTFKLSKTQEQSYYAIRIFGAVHLIAAIGLIVLLDGPGDGVGGFARFLIALILIVVALLGYQIYRAAVHQSIYRHYVLTKNTLALKQAGKPCQFFRRRDCTAFVPSGSEFVFRGKQRLFLKPPAMGRYHVRQMTEDVARTWWPQFYGGPVWAPVAGLDPPDLIDVKVSFLGTGDSPFPVLKYPHSRKGWLGVSFSVVAGFCWVVLYSQLLYDCYYVARHAKEHGHPWIGPIAGTATALGLLFFGWLVLERYWKSPFWRRDGRYVILSRRGMRVRVPGSGWFTLRPQALTGYAPRTGAFRRSDGTFIPVVPDFLTGQPEVFQYLKVTLDYWGMDYESGFGPEAQNASQYHILNMFLLSALLMGYSAAGEISYGVPLGPLGIVAFGLMVWVYVRRTSDQCVAMPPKSEMDVASDDSGR